MHSKPRVVVWRMTLLPGSETFVRNQVDSMQDWDPILVGAVREQSPLTRDDDVVIFPGTMLGKLRYKIFRLTGWSPVLTRKVRALNPEVIQAHFATDAWRILKTAKSLNVPLIVTVHGADVTRAPVAEGAAGKRARKRLAEVFSYSSLNLPVSGFIRSAAIRWGAKEENTFVHHLGVPIHPLQPAEDLATDILFVGRLFEKKGVDDLLEAVNLISQERDVRLKVKIIGDGPLREDLEAQAVGIPSDIEFLGSQPPEVVREALRTSRLFVGPSKTAANGDSEGLPTVFVEASSAALPAVGYRHSGIPEITEHGKTGLLAEERDVEMLTTYIKRLLDNEEERRAMGKAAQEKAINEFDMVTQTRRMEEVFTRLREKG